jgi:hypothetical protein
MELPKLPHEGVITAKGAKIKLSAEVGVGPERATHGWMIGTIEGSDVLEPWVVRGQVVFGIG